MILTCLPFMYSWIGTRTDRRNTEESQRRTGGFWAFPLRLCVDSLVSHCIPLLKSVFADRQTDRQTEKIRKQLQFRGRLHKTPAITMGR